MELQIIQNKIYEIRGLKVMLDFDLAELYDVQTKALKQSVRRNIKRFPSDFMFILTAKEWELVTNCDQFPNTLKHSSAMPFAFTEQGVAMLSGILKSETNMQFNDIYQALTELMSINEEQKKRKPIGFRKNEQ